MNAPFVGSGELTRSVAHHHGVRAAVVPGRDGEPTRGTGSGSAFRSREAAATAGLGSFRTTAAPDEERAVGRENLSHSRRRRIVDAEARLRASPAANQAKRI